MHISQCIGASLSFLDLQVHGSVGEPWWLWVEDPINDHIYHSEYILLQKKQAGVFFFSCCLSCLKKMTLSDIWLVVFLLQGINLCQTLHTALFFLDNNIIKGMSTLLIISCLNCFCPLAAATGPLNQSLGKSPQCGIN